MPVLDPHSRRDFLATAGAAVAASAVPSWAAPAGSRRRYALVGTGMRGTRMWGRDIQQRYPDVAEFVGLCDVNPLRAAAGQRYIGASCPTFTHLDEMLSATKPDVLIVTTVDAAHAGCIVAALDRGIDVITEKPMVIDEAQCRAVLAAEKRSGRKLTVTFNYRYAPKHQLIKETLMSGAIGRVTSVDFSWYLDVRHGADYFRRWHRLRAQGGSLWVHKATHHFDLVNWWLDADPLEVTAAAKLDNYGRNGPFRHTHCRPCPHKAQCAFHWDITRDQGLVELYNDCESADGYHRDGCVFREDVDIFDSMNALVRYSSGVSMSYSVSAFMPFEGYRVAFNGTKGRLEVRDYERQPWTVEEESDAYLTRNFGQREKLTIPEVKGGHGGGDDRLRDLIFRGAAAPEHMRLPGSRAGAMSCLTGIAARKSADEGRTVRLSELLPA
ncbi:MAG TPA: Gfo/Idh/MocA family oxidoreductase [Vicinamibacteria bacterium]|nr:Gfo/Idh/MocA family oxidoreductase [Vicinamibacteria bacterium]